jgi:hypothetical protein
MRKITFVLVALVLAAPALGDVVITCSQVSDCVVEVSYNAETEAELVRAFALDITVDAGTITAVDCVNTDYDIYPGSIQIDENGNVTDAGSCACDSSYPGTLGGIGTSGVTIEMGSLYEVGVEDPPAKLGALVRITVDASCNVSIAENAIRGGIVMEDPDQVVTVQLNGCAATCGVAPCLGDLSDTGGFGAPDQRVDIGDLNALLMAMLIKYPEGDPTGLYDVTDQGLAGYPDCSDTGGFGDPDDLVNIGDLNAILMAMLTAYPEGDPTGIYLIPCL